MNIPRHLKNQRKRASQIVGQKIEMLAAAYVKETNIPASRARLCQEVVGNTLHVWFEDMTNENNADSTADGTDLQADQLANRL